jgi:hypothetical protein
MLRTQLTNRLVVGRDLLAHELQLRQQGQHEALLGACDTRCRLQLRPVELLPQCLRFVLCQRIVRRAQQLCDLLGGSGLRLFRAGETRQDGLGHVAGQAVETRQRARVVGFEAGRQLVHQARLRGKQTRQITREGLLVLAATVYQDAARAGPASHCAPCAPTAAHRAHRS